MRTWKKLLAFCLALILLLSVNAGNRTTWIHASDASVSPTSNMRTVGQFAPYTVIDDFESDESLANWQAGDNVSEASLAAQAWNVFFPYEGSKFLALKSEPNLQNNVWRTASRTFDQPLDLSNSRYLMMAYNHFGYLPNDEPYYARLVAYSGDTSVEGIVRVYNNNWNKIGIDLSGWAGRSAIDKLEVSFQHDFDRAEHPDDPLPYWPNTEFYIDYVHAANMLDWQFSYEGDTEGWSFNDSIESPSVSDGRLSLGLAGGNSAMTSAPLKLDPAVYNLVRLKLGNGAEIASGRLYWTTETDPEFDEAKSQALESAEAIDGENVYSARLIGHPRWTGQVTGLRLQLAGVGSGTNTIAIDGIDFAKQDRPIYDYIGEVSEIRVDANAVTVTGRIGDDANIGNGVGVGNTSTAQLQLYELAPYQYEPDIDALTPISTSSVPSGNDTFSFHLDRFDGDRDRYYSKFLVVVREAGEDGSVRYVDAPKSVTDIAFPAKHSFAYPDALSKKGLNVQMTDDAEELGVSHATLTVVVNGLMYKDDTDPNNAIAFDSEGTAYHFHKDAVEELDREIKAMSDNGTIVNLVLILYDADDPDGSTNVLIHPDAARGQGTVYAFNTTNAEGVRYYKAAMEFLADRYTREDQRYGRAMGYIVGNEVDSAWIWQNMGDKSVDQFMEHYERSVRLAYQAVRKHSDSARVYISVDNAWNDPYMPNQPTRFYGSKDVVDKMNVLSKLGGDYPWHLAHHPYPENMLDPRTWEDQEYVSDSFDSPKITFKNLQVIDRYMGQETLKYGNERRRIILSEQGFHTENDTPEAQRLQAAAYVYAYYKSRFLDGIDAFIMFNQLDIPAAGLNMGLWTANTELPGFVAKDRKFIYDVFKYIDTDRSLEVAEFAKPIIGIENWSEVVPNFDAAKLAQRMPPQLVPVSINKQAPHIVGGDKFETGIDGWEFADHSYGVSRTTADAYGGTGSLKVDFVDLVRMTFVGLERLWKGAEKKFAEPIDATGKPHLNLAVKLTEPEESHTYYAKVKVYSGDLAAEGLARIDASKGWHALSLDLKGWEGLDAIDRIKVWTRKTTNESWSGSLLIDEVGFSSKNTAIGGLPNIDMVATTDLDELAPGSTITVKVTNYDDKKMSGQIRIEPIGNLSFHPKMLKLNGLKTGETQSMTLQVSDYDPSAGGDVGIRFKYRSIAQETILVSNE
jgi:hypothetical protein